MTLRHPVLVVLLLISVINSACIDDSPIQISCFKFEKISARNFLDTEEVTQLFSFKTGKMVDIKNFFLKEKSASGKFVPELLMYFSDFFPDKNETQKEFVKSVLGAENIIVPSKITNNIKDLGIIISDEVKLKETDIPFNSINAVHIKYKGIFPSGRYSYIRHHKVKSLFLKIKGDEIFKPEFTGLANIKTILIDVNCDDGKFFSSAGKELFEWITDFKKLELLIVRGDSCNHVLEFDPLKLLSKLVRLKQTYISGFAFSKNLSSAVSKNIFFEFRNEKTEVKGKLDSVKYLDIYGDFPGEILKVIPDLKLVENVRLFGVSDAFSVEKIISNMTNLKNLYIKVKKFKGGVVDFNKFKMLEDLHLESNITEGNLNITGNGKLKRLSLILDLKKNNSLTLRKMESVELLKINLNGASVNLETPLSSIRSLVLDKIKIEGFGNFAFPSLENLAVNSGSKMLDLTGAIALKQLLLMDFKGRLVGGFKSQKKIEKLYIIKSIITYNISELEDKIQSLYLLIGNNPENHEGKIFKTRGIKKLVIKSELRSRKQNPVKCPAIFPMQSLSEIEISGCEIGSSLLLELSKLKHLKILKIGGLMKNSCEGLLKKCELNSRKCDLFNIDCNALRLPDKNTFNSLQSLEIEEITKEVFLYKKHFQFFADLKYLKKFHYDNWNNWNIRYVHDVFSNANWNCQDSDFVSIKCSK